MLLHLSNEGHDYCPPPYNESRNGGNNGTCDNFPSRSDAYGALCVKSFIQIIFRRNMFLGVVLHTYFHTGIPTYQHAFDR